MSSRIAQRIDARSPVYDTIGQIILDADTGFSTVPFEELFRCMYEIGWEGGGIIRIGVRLLPASPRPDVNGIIVDSSYLRRRRIDDPTLAMAIPAMLNGVPCHARYNSAGELRVDVNKITVSNPTELFIKGVV